MADLRKSVMLVVLTGLCVALGAGSLRAEWWKIYSPKDFEDCSTSAQQPGVFVGVHRKRGDVGGGDGGPEKRLPQLAPHAGIRLFLQVEFQVPELLASRVRHDGLGRRASHLGRWMPDPAEGLLCPTPVPAGPGGEPLEAEDEIVRSDISVAAAAVRLRRTVSSVSMRRWRLARGPGGSDG